MIDSNRPRVAMIRFACPSCEKLFKVPATMGGKPATCTKCQTQFLIPTVPSEADKNRPPSQLSLPSLTVPEVFEAEVVDEVPPPPSKSKLFIPAVLEPCPQCTAVLTVNRDDVGQSVVCPYCQSTYVCVEQQNLEPPAAPPSSKLLIPRELEPCPRCTAVNTVASEYVGMPIECPFCKTVYLGEPRRPLPPPPPPMYIPMPMFPTHHGRTGYWSMPSMSMPLSPPPPPPPVVIFSPPTTPADGVLRPHIPVSFGLPPPLPSAAASPPVKPPPPPQDVPIAPCPLCRAELVVAPETLGEEVSCPYCGTKYQAEPPTAKEGTQLAKVVRRPGQPVAPPKKKKKNSLRFWWNNTTDGGDDDPWPKGRIT